MNIFPPEVDARSKVVELGKSIPMHTMFTWQDRDGDSLEAVRFRDNNGVNYGSFFTLQGVRQIANAWIEIPVSLLFEVQYQAALILHNESVSFQVKTNGQWSAADSAVMFTRDANNFAPTVTADATSILSSESMLVEPLINVADRDRNPVVTQYYFVDRSFNANGGYFQYKGRRMPSAQWFIVQADEIDQLRYVGGRFGPQTENIGVRAYDGKFWSDPFDFAVTSTANNHAPVVDAFDVRSAPGRSFLARSLFSFTDADGNTPKAVGFLDTAPGAGNFTVNGVVQPDGRFFVVPYTEIDTVRYNTASFGAVENFRVYAYDGQRFSSVSVGSVESVPRPDIDVVEADVWDDDLVHQDVSALISKVDPGPAHTRYRIWDSNSDPLSGKFWFNNAPLEQGVLQSMTAAEFAGITFETAPVDNGRTLDEISIQAFNGVFWTEWEQIRFTTEPEVGLANESRVFEVHRIPDFERDGNLPTDNFVNWRELTWNEARGKFVIPYAFIQGDTPNGPRPPLQTYYPCPPTPELPFCNNPEDLDLAQRNDVRAALADIERFTDIDFVEVPYTLTGTNAIMHFGRWDADGPNGVLARVADFPDGIGFGSPGGDVWYDNADYPDGSPVGPGSDFRTTTIHEIGHALGMKHTFEAPISLPTTTDYFHHSLMSYTPDATHHPETPSTFMLYDYLTLQMYYNANEEYNTGNDHYIYLDTQTNLTTLYDADGNDTYNLTLSFQDELINLNQGEYSSVHGVNNSTLIPYGVRIENARGGRGNDTIIGNQVRNLLFGNQGSDRLEGGGGNDVLRGGAQNDTYVWGLGDGRDLIREEGHAGVDTLEVSEPFNLDALEDDFTFRKQGRDLRIDFTIDQGVAQGTFKIANMAWGGWQVERLRMIDGTGMQIGEDVDLRSIWAQATDAPQRFRLTDTQGDYGFIAVPV